MNYQYPIPGSTGVANAFTADNTGVLGDIDQSPEAKTRVLVDYSQLNPAVTATGYSFRVRPGGEPQLLITSSTLGTTPSTTLTFMVSGGIGGRQYQLAVDATLNTGEVRTDVLNVNVLGDDCGCQLIAPPTLADDAVSGDGSIIVNTAPRFFVSATPPVGAHVLDRWFNVVNGQTYDLITTGLTTEWVQANTGGGGGGGSTGNIVQIDPILPDGVSTTFPLAAPDITVNVVGTPTLFVSLDGVWQQPIVQYQASGAQVMFADPPSADSVIFMIWFAPTPTPPPYG